MKVEPEYKSFGELFNETNVFITPKYQRDYSWGFEQIEQFCGDIDNAIKQKDTGHSPEHFFGGVVCAQKRGVGNRKVDNILVDGQQRLSTVIILFSILKSKLENIVVEGDDLEFKESLLEDVEKYLHCKERVNRENIRHDRIKIGNSDNDYFQALVACQPIAESRDSHKLMRDAKNSIEQFLEVNVFNSTSVAGLLDSVDSLISLFKESFLLIHIITTSIDDAYKLFMVLNDRGINLTEGELLKAHTLGTHSETDPFVIQMAHAWDEILKFDANSVSDYLRWSLIMLTGNHVTASEVLDKYRDVYFTSNLSLEQKAEKVIKLRDCVCRLNVLSKAEWPYQNISNQGLIWHKMKLDWLINRLKHTHSMPVLLAASFANEITFKNIVNELCKFFIRYKVISSFHAGIFSNMYSNLALNIYGNPNTYQISQLHGEFRNVLNSKDPSDLVFKAGIRSLQYKRSGDNKPLKYLMVYIEENWRWLTNGNGNGSIAQRLRQEDHTRVFDFNNTTLEHLYPYSAREADRDIQLEEVKNSIGNLVLLDPNTNSSNADMPFSEKVQTFQPGNTGIGIHTHICQKTSWTEDEVEELTLMYLDYASRVFSF